MRIEWLIAGALLAACQQGGVVRVEQTVGSARFTVDGPAPGSEACVDDLSLYAGLEAQGAPLWHIAATDGAPCTRHFRLGDVPRGYSADAGPVPALTPGLRYTVMASGKGFLVGGRFTAAAR